MKEYIILLGIVACFALGHWVGHVTGQEVLKRQAVAHGAAHWVVYDGGEIECVWGKPTN